MAENVQPIVSVVTPVYNGEKYLPECIESVLSQTYKNYEYLIVNNCSKDGSLEIARRYARSDNRIRVHDNVEFLEIIANHNHAFRQISPSAKYCKVVSADDVILPDCLKQMVEFAEANPTVGIIGSYQQSGERVLWHGFPYPRTVFPGREVCRRIFLGENPGFGFGAPTSLLYRADLIRKVRDFFPDPSPHSDTSACFAAMQHNDYGFIYQLLSFERAHEATQSSKSAKINSYAPANLNDLLRYGRAFLTEPELKVAVQRMLNGYYRFLAINYFGKSQGPDFWIYHRNRLQEMGFPLKHFRLVKALLTLVWKELGNPELALRKFQDSKVRKP
jgi:glycosyltransferase involved in cell wall biosynthesis